MITPAMVLLLGIDLHYAIGAANQGWEIGFSSKQILLRESSRSDGKVVKRTLANLSDWPASQVLALRRILKGESLVSPADAFQIQRAAPHGHVAAAFGTLRRLGLEPLLSRSPGPQRDLVVAMIVAHILEPASKLTRAESTATERNRPASPILNLCSNR